MTMRRIFIMRSVGRNAESNRLIRDAKEKVNDAEREIQIADIQKQIDLLEDQKDLIEEQISLLDEQAESINKYYDELIKNTEKFYDEQIKAIENLISSLEKQKSKYEELTEMVESAKMSALLKELGINEEALLNGSEEEFQKLKDAYLGIIADMNSGNEAVLENLAKLGGYSDGKVPSFLNETKEVLDEVDGGLDSVNGNLDNTNSKLDNTSSKTSETASNLGDAAENSSDLSEKLGDTATNASELSINLGDATQSTTSLVESLTAVNKISFKDIIQKLQDLMDKINNVGKCVDGAEGGIDGAIRGLNNISLDVIIKEFTDLQAEISKAVSTLSGSVSGNGDLLAGGAVTSGLNSLITALNQIDLTPVIVQFNNLKESIDSVTASIGGGSDGGTSQGENSGSQSGSSDGSSSGNGSSKGNDSSLAGAIQGMGETASEVIGEPEAEGDGTVIGEFGSMETAVNDVTAAIGTEEGNNSGGESSKGTGENSDGTLIGSIQSLGEQTQEVLGESGDNEHVIGKFEEFRDVIENANEHVAGISTGLDEIDGKEVECTIKVNIETSGSIPHFAEGTVLGSMNLNSAEYVAKYGNAHAEGTAQITGRAYIKGDWGLKQSQDALCGELGQELVVHRNGTFETVGDNGAEMRHFEAGDIIFNAEQTKKLLSEGHISGRGRAYADGTVGFLPPNLRLLQPGDQSYELFKKWDAYMQGKNLNDIILPLSAVQKNTDELSRSIQNAGNINNNQKNVEVHQNITLNCPNVTNSSGVEYINKELGNLALKAMQVSMKH